MHAAGKDGDASLCGVPVSGKAEPQVHASGQAAKVAPHVTCKFCQARLVAAGVLDQQAEGVSPYAADYGTRDAEDELAAIAREKSKTS